MDVPYHASHIPRRVTDALLVVAGLQRCDVLLEGLVPEPAVRLVEGVDATPGRDLDIGVGEDEVSRCRVEGEPVCAGADGEDKDAGGGVETVARRHQRRTWSEGVEQAAALDLHLVQDLAVVHRLLLFV
eukprot:CAMPEP_0202836100 /NCGR_PEP_ID=MMETSP1389-20130828/39775_1 /ASSEMBLY_ACC=CAM_ASM_000865 /TAXON_ID=302021 /ORGANISM="Rhodomonas sp., Strain CCMP768" /LENGTH=128 /DNA_ID=CAMNT_0049511785 /DNA_START=420 /DNA_END=802 /DNA_ORIENTATION=+